MRCVNTGFRAAARLAGLAIVALAMVTATASAAVGRVHVSRVHVSRVHASRHHAHPHHGGTSGAKEAQPGPAPQGPVVISVSIRNQKLTVYDVNGAFAQSPVSTGRSGHGTPMGVFSVIEKEPFHRSNLYHNAAMPHMQRLTWSGVAMHAGLLPGYPASHGCIRLPPAFARRLYRWTTPGARVIVTPGELAPSSFSHPLLASGQLLLRPALASAARPGPPPDIAPVETAPSEVPEPPQAVPELRSTVGHQEEITNVLLTHDDAVPVTNTIAAENAPAGVLVVDAEPVSSATAAPANPASRKPDAAIAVFISGSQSKVYVRENFAALFDAPVRITPTDRPLGTHVFTAVSDPGDASALRWSVVSLPQRSPAADEAERNPRHRHRKAEVAPESATAPQDSAAEALDRIAIPTETMARIRELLVPGASIIVSDQGIDPDETGRGRDFTVLWR